MSSSQVIFDSVNNLKLTLVDIKNGFKIKEQNKNLVLSTLNKVHISNLDRANVNEGCQIKIIDENHTIGNLLQHYIRSKYLKENNSSNKELKIAAYRMNHPTIEEIDFILVPNDDLEKTQIIDTIREILEKNGELSNIDYDILNSEYIDKLKHYMCVLLFIKSINDAIRDVDQFINEFSALTGVTDTIYEIAEDQSYYVNNNY